MERTLPKKISLVIPGGRGSTSKFTLTEVSHNSFVLATLESYLDLSQAQLTWEFKTSIRTPETYSQNIKNWTTTKTFDLCPSSLTPFLTSPNQSLRNPSKMGKSGKLKMILKPNDQDTTYPLKPQVPPESPESPNTHPAQQMPTHEPLQINYFFHKKLERVPIPKPDPNPGPLDHSAVKMRYNYGDQCAYLFTLDKMGNQLQFRLRDKNLIHNWRNEFEEIIACFKVSIDNRYIYIAYGVGKMRKFDVESRKMVKDYGQIVENSIWSIDIDKNEEYLFVLPVEGPLVQFSTATNFHRDWDRNIVCFRLTRNGKYLFGQDEENHLKQWNVLDQSLVHDWKPLHDGSDYFFKVSKDDKDIWSRDNSGYLKQWNIESKFVRNWGIVLDGKILSNTTSKNGKKMYTIGLDRCIRIWDIKKQKLLCKWEVAAIEGEQDQTNLILFIKGKFLFLLSRNGQLYQYSEKKRALVKKWGAVLYPGQFRNMYRISNKFF